ncbi:hypothetical protein ACU61A_20640 [Pseudonocardia sichuanensis]
MADSEEDRGEAADPRPDPQPQRIDDVSATAPDQPSPDVLPDDQFKGILARTVRYYTRFTGPVYANSLSIGGEQRAARHYTGRIDDEVEPALRYFTEPRGFAEAADRLAAGRLVVLAGAERTGRRCGAIALLTRRPPAKADVSLPIIELAPSSTMSELVECDFERGGRYVWAGFAPADGAEDQLSFDVGQLAKRLRAAEACMVITSRAATKLFDSFGLTWERVDCRAVLDTYLSTSPDRYSPEETSALHGVAGRRLLREMEQFFETLEKHGPDGVQRLFEQGAIDEAMGWVSEGKDLPYLLPAVTAAFLPDALEHEHERHLARLHSEIDQHAHRDPGRQPYAVTLARSRLDAPWWLHRAPHPLRRDERVIGMQGGVTSELLMIELHRCYGRELWAPVHEWLCALPTTSSDIETEQALARGMAALIAVDRRSAEAVLGTWSRGSIHDRWAAAASISALCSDDSAQSLRFAMRWFDGNREQRMTAAFAFGQALSSHYPVESMSYLWHLTLRDQRVALYARTQFAALVHAVSPDAQRLRRALSIEEKQLAHLAATNGDEGPLMNAALRTVAEILAVIYRDEDIPLTLHILRHLPDKAPEAGALWAEVLRSWELRADALDTLRATFVKLTTDEEAHAFGELSDAIRGRVGVAEWRWLCRDGGIAAWTEAQLQPEAVR